MSKKFLSVALALEPAPTAFASETELIDKIETIGNWVFTILLTIAGIFVIIAGFMWVTAAGNPEGITKARTMLINSIIGVAVGLLAKGMVEIIRTILAP